MATLSMHFCLKRIYVTCEEEERGGEGRGGEGEEIGREGKKWQIYVARCYVYKVVHCAFHTFGLVVAGSL